MKHYAGLPERGVVDGPSAVTIGVFDGLHVGHMTLLRQLRATADELGGPCVVMSFRTHPDALLRGKAPDPLMSIEDRLAGFAAAGVDHVFLLDFTPELRRLRAMDFARDVLRDGLGCARFVLGYDSAICYEREGNAARFCELGVSATSIEACLVEGLPAAATTIRALLREGQVETAASVLGRPYRMRGRVVQGDARGRELGFPTANLDVGPLCRPASGVYAVRCFVRDRQASTELPRSDDGAASSASTSLTTLNGVANLGTRPTFGSDTMQRVEVHLFDFDGDLYGRELHVDFVGPPPRRARLRVRRRTPRQIAADCDAARALVG